MKLTDDAFAEMLCRLFKELRHPDVMRAIKHRTRLIFLLQALDADMVERMPELQAAGAPDQDGGR